MQSKTITTLDQLRIGDSFVYLKRQDPWRVTARADKNGKVAVNQFNCQSGVDPKNQLYRHDNLVKGSRQVMFLRHTIPVPGEECLICDLEPGDVFQIPGDTVHDYEIVHQSEAGFATIRRLDQAAPAKAGIHAKAIFIRKKIN